MCDRPKRRPDVHWVEADGAVVAVDPTTRTVHVLRGATAAVWQILDGDSLAGLDLLIAETFGVEPAAAASDIDVALGSLEGLGLISHERPAD